MHIPLQRDIVLIEDKECASSVDKPKPDGVKCAKPKRSH